jgi:hypothetical protein
MKSHIVAALGVVILVSASGGFGDTGPELPYELWRAIVRGDRMAIVWCDWDAVGDLPMIRRALESEDDAPLNKIPMIGSTLRAVKVAEPIVGEISEVWCEMEKVDGGRRDAAWMKTGLEEAQIRSRLEAAGWHVGDRDRSIFTQPFDPVRDRWVFSSIEASEAHPEFDLAEFLSQAADGKWHIHVGEEGWIHVAPHVVSLKRASFLYSPDVEAQKAEGLGFPFSALLAEQKPDLCMMAIDVPGNDGEEGQAPESNSVDEEIRVLESQLRKLRDQDEAEILVRTGDMLLSATETDGGVALDLEAAMPSGESGELSIQVLQGTLMLLRLVIFWVGAELSRDLEATVFRDTGESIVASVVVSRASLFEAVDRLVAHDEQMRALTERIETLREQQRQLDAELDPTRPLQ